MVHVNPFAHLPVAKSIAKRERVLSDGEIGDVWRAAVSAPYGTIIRLLILTGQRRGEVAGMTWGELSDDLSTWTIPGERTKNGAVHVVPLSEPARALLRGSLRADISETKRVAPDALVLPGAASTPFSGWSKARRPSTGPWRIWAVRASHRGACTICAGQSRRACSASGCGSK